MIKKVKNVLLTVIILLSLAGIVHAEQTSTIKYLMTEPLTLFDLGIYKLDKLMISKFEKARKHVTVVGRRSFSQLP